MTNVYELFQLHFSHQLKSLKEISHDKENDQYLVDISDGHYSFDNIVDEYFVRSMGEIRKFDAIMLENEKIYCVEFKNSTPRHVKNKEVKEKASEGYASLAKICHDNALCLNKYDLIYLVVYKAPNKTDSINRIHSSINRNEIKFGLEKYKNKFYNEILTIDHIEFEKIYLEGYKGNQ